MKDKLNKLVNTLGCKIIIDDNDSEEDYIVYTQSLQSFSISPSVTPLYKPKPLMSLKIGSKMRIELIEELVDSKIKAIEDYNQDDEIRKKSEATIAMIRSFENS